MIISHVEDAGIAQQLGLKSGDTLVEINGRPINDIIDYRFHSSDEFLEIKINRNGREFYFDIEKDADEELGLSFKEIKYRCCGNKCIFCFVDQNPDKLRRNLYFKDEDFRLSFLHGNYVTLTNIKRTDLERIAAQRLSPLFVSVHATDPDIRRQMLGLKKDDKLLEKISYLIDQRIVLHAQIVLCPGINDGTVLEQTLTDLEKFHPLLKSIAIVPVGLTKHRQGLHQLNAMTPAVAADLVSKIELQSKSYLKRYQTHLVYLADEIYLLANQIIPEAGRYDEFDQYENGVGMLRHFMDIFNDQSLQFPSKIAPCQDLYIVTGELANEFISKTVVPRLNKIEGLRVTPVVVQNNFYGHSVKVTGLMTGTDIYSKLSDLIPVDMVLLPENCINHEGFFLDDWTIEMLENRLKMSVKVMGLEFETLLKELSGI